MLSALLEGLLRNEHSGPRLPMAKLHHPPVVQTSTFTLHELQGRSITRRDLKLDLFCDQHACFLLSVV